MLELTPTELDDELFESLKTMDKVKETLLRMGIGEPKQPEGELPKAPEDMDSLTDSQLGSLYSKILGYYDYISYHLAVYEGYKAEADNQLKYIKAKLKTNDREKELEANPIYLHVLRVQQEAEQSVTMLEATKSILSRQMQMVSRNVEIRKLDWEKSRRYDGIRHDPVKAFKEKKSSDR